MSTFTTCFSNSCSKSGTRKLQTQKDTSLKTILKGGFESLRPQLHDFSLDVLSCSARWEQIELTGEFGLVGFRCFRALLFTGLLQQSMW